MKIVLAICVLLAVVGGVSIGKGVANRQYAEPENRFGPFGDPQSDAATELKELFSVSEQAGKPRAEVVDGNEHDFGVMLRNASSSHDFEVKNVGTGPLRLEVVGSTCKCTVGSLDESVLQPGESTVVKLEWSAKTNSRTFSQSATIKTNDPTQHEVVLVVQGDVVELVAAEPTSWSLAEISGTVDLTVKTTLFNHSDRPIELISAEWLDERFGNQSQIVWERREVDPGQDVGHTEAIEAFDVTAVVRAPLPQGPLAETMRVRYQPLDSVAMVAGDEELAITGDDDEELKDDHPPLDLPLMGEVVGDLSVMGGKRLYVNDAGVARLSLDRVAVGQVSEQQVYVAFRGPLRKEAKLRLAQIAPAGSLEAELGEPAERGSMMLYPLTVRTKADSPEIQRSGRSDDDFGIITIESDNSEVAPYRLTVLFRIG
ncbi:DUF1573 domain-containing protein [Planctomycetaceae bacterium SH139]